MSLIKFRGIQCNCDRVILALIFLSEVNSGCVFCNYLNKYSKY